MSMGNSGNSTTTSNPEVSNLLVQGFKTAKEGRRDEAYEIFCDVVRRDPNNELGWLYRAATTEDLSEAYVCLQRVLSLNPNNEKAQRGVERIQNRLAAESNKPKATAAGAAAAGGTATPQPVSPSLEDKDVISGFNPGFSRTPVTPTPEPPSQPTARYAYQQAPSPFNPAPESAEGAVAPYRPDFGQLNAANRYQPGGPSADGGYSQTNSPDEDYEDEDDEGMVDEPVMDPSGRVGSQRELTNSRRAGLVGGLAAARQRGRAAFGSETPTDLDAQGRRRSQRILIPLVILGVILVVVAVALLLFAPKNNTDNNQQAVVATNTAGNATSASTTAAQATTAAAAITVPVVGNTTSAAGTTAAARTTTAATTAAAATTAQAAVTTAAATAPTTTAAPATTAPVATTAAPPAATTAAAPPPVTTAQAPSQPRAIVYTIKGGDNLTNIARNYSTTIAAITAANPSLAANSSNIFAGARIIIPVSRPDFKGKGAILGNNETLQTVADRYKVSVDDLARFNGFASPADAKPGDAILVP